MDRMDIGGMDTKIVLQQCVITQGDSGEKIYNWKSGREAFAKVERNEDEVVDNGNLEQGSALTLTIWKVPNLTTRWRVLIGGSAYAIESIDPVSRISPICKISVRAII